MATEAPASPPMPRLRLNTSLATDPARNAVSATPTPTPPPPPSLPASASEYLASLPPAIQSAIAAGLLPLAFPPPGTPPLVRPPSAPLDAPPPRQLSVPLYMCSPCGIRFSSLSTLEAHQTYYCSHRVIAPKTTSEDDAKTTSDAANSHDDSATTQPDAKNQKTGKQYACTHCSYSADKKVSLNRHMRMHSVSPGPPSLPGSTTSNGEVHSDLAASSSPAAAQQFVQDRYCADCDIRFSSTKTFRAHKMHYCSTRQVVKSAQNSVAASNAATKSGSSCTSGSAPPSPNDPCKSPASPPSTSTNHHNNNSQPLLALPTNPILIVPYSLFRSASLLTGSTVPGMPNSDTPCFLMPNGTIQPMSQAFPGVQRSSSMSAATPLEVLKSANKPRDSITIKDASIPLDLSMRRSPECKTNNNATGEIDEQEKENRLQRSMTPEQIVCAPSLPGSPPLTPSPKQGSSPHSMDASPKRKYRDSRSVSPRRTTPTPKSHSDESVQLSPKSKTPVLVANPMHPFPAAAAMHPNLLREIALRFPDFPISAAAAVAAAASAATASPPQVLVKQGVSKCKECNIVFCKYESFLAHKKHYCSARSDDDGKSMASSTTSPPPPPSPTMTTNNGGKAASPPQYHQQLICAACGIKFTSLDNLTAHQSYYCAKRAEVQLTTDEASSLRRCAKCKQAVALDAQHVCSPAGAVGAEGGGWRCPCCGVVSATASAAQRHLDSHGGVRAFRCTICRYKGNTLRGMRTHIRMHFPKRAADLQEENFITCILEDEANAAARSATDGASTPTATPTPLLLSSSTPTLPPPPHSPDQPRPADHRLHYCDSCNYSSTYKGNVVRHARLVHSGNSSSCKSSSFAIGEGDEPLVLPNGTNKLDHHEDEDGHEEEVVIKKEAAPKIEDEDDEEDKEERGEEEVKSPPPAQPEVVVAVKQEAQDEQDFEAAEQAKQFETKYCKSCDISFKYMSTFMAHKKFYCASHAGESAANNNLTAAAARATEASVL